MMKNLVNSLNEINGVNACISNHYISMRVEFSCLVPALRELQHVLNQDFSDRKLYVVDRLRRHINRAFLVSEFTVSKRNTSKRGTKVCLKIKQDDKHVGNLVITNYNDHYSDTNVLIMLDFATEDSITMIIPDSTFYVNGEVSTCRRIKSYKLSEWEEGKLARKILGEKYSNLIAVGYNYKGDR